jgi:hypothetical protein
VPAVGLDLDPFFSRAVVQVDDVAADRTDPA